MVLQYVVDKEMRKTSYNDMLGDDIREFLSFSGCKTLNDMIKIPTSGRLTWSSGRSESQSRFKQLWIRLREPRPPIRIPVAIRVGEIAPSAASHIVEPVVQ